MGAQKNRQTQLFPNEVVSKSGVSGGNAIRPATNVVKGDDRVRFVRTARFFLENVVVSVLAANDYGGTAILTLPDSNLVVIGAVVNVELTKDGTGIQTATDVTAALGTAVASGTGLTGEESNLISSSLTADENPAIWKDHTNNQTTPALAFVKQSATSIFLNAAATITADGSLTANGYVDLYYIDTGETPS